jgi:hypothetical protein
MAWTIMPAGMTMVAIVSGMMKRLISYGANGMTGFMLFMPCICLR